MNKEEIEAIANLRRVVVEQHENLDAGVNPSTAMMKTSDAAVVYEHAIKELDKLLSKYVQFV